MRKLKKQTFKQQGHDVTLPMSEPWAATTRKSREHYCYRIYMLGALQCHPSRRTQTYILKSSAAIANTVHENMQHKNTLFEIFAYLKQN